MYKESAPEDELTGELFLRMLSQGITRLGANRQAINDLNVFPIPDGDTGDNMCLTIESGYAQASSLSGSSLSETASAASSGMLMGARGNSGVILSRIFSGLAKGLEGLSSSDTAGFANAMAAAVTEAYSSVAHPVEGTILTVVREGTEAAAPSVGSGLDGYLSSLIHGMEDSLEHTPEKLQVLADAGVVDSGGAGLLQIFYGFHDAVLGLGDDNAVVLHEQKAQKIDLSAFDENTELEFGYCTEFLLRLQSSKVDLKTFDEKEIEEYILGAGDSVVFFREGSIIKVHVHTKTPGDILSHCQKWGEFLTVKIENMTLQHHNSTFAEHKPPVRRKDYGTVAVVSGSGMESIFGDLGVDSVIPGGQTMNPSVADFVAAFDSIPARTIFVFPNNSNVILTARQAAEIYADAKVSVIPTKDIGSGYVSLASFDPSEPDPDALEQALTQTAGSVVCGMVSCAIRDAENGHVSVHKGEFIGFQGDDILCEGATRNEAAVLLCRETGADEHDVAIVFSGADAQEDAPALYSELQSAFPLTEFIFQHGGQAVYDYIIVLC